MSVSGIPDTETKSRGLSFFAFSVQYEREDAVTPILLVEYTFVFAPKILIVILKAASLFFKKVSDSFAAFASLAFPSGSNKSSKRDLTLSSCSGVLVVIEIKASWELLYFW